MNKFLEQRARDVRRLADMADPFTRTRLLKLAERYDHEIGLRPKPERQTPLPSITIDELPS